VSATGVPNAQTPIAPARIVGTRIYTRQQKQLRAARRRVRGRRRRRRSSEVEEEVEEDIHVLPLCPCLPLLAESHGSGPESSKLHCAGGLCLLGRALLPQSTSSKIVL